MSRKVAISHRSVRYHCDDKNYEVNVASCRGRISFLRNGMDERERERDVGGWNFSRAVCVIAGRRGNNDDWWLVFVTITSSVRWKRFRTYNYRGRSASTSAREAQYKLPRASLVPAYSLRVIVNDGQHLIGLDQIDVWRIPCTPPCRGTGASLELSFDKTARLQFLGSENLSRGFSFLIVLRESYYTAF